MTLNELIAEVYTKTKRPDLVDRTKQAVKKVTLECHQLDFFSKDIFESGMVFVTSTYLQQIDLAIIPRYRAIKYLRKCDSAGVPVIGTSGKFKIISPDQVFDRYGIDQTDVAYVAGQVVNLKSSTEFQYLLTGWYQNPDISDSGYSSWIAVAHPYLIINKAVQSLYVDMGKNTEAQAINAEIGPLINSLYTSNTTDVGS